VRYIGSAATAVTLLLGVGASQASAAETPPPLPASVVLNPTAPRPDERVTSDRTISGQAQALEGVRSVSLYVVPAGAPLDLTTHRPESSTVSPVSLDAVTFQLPWRVGGPRDVDLYVVAATWVRQFRIVVPGVRVRQAGHASVPKRWVSRSSQAEGPSARPVRGTADPDQSGLGVFIGGFDAALPYPAKRPTAVRRPGRAPGPIPAGDDSRRTSPWTSLSAGLVLLLGSAHVHRVLRPDPTPRGDR